MRFLGIGQMSILEMRTAKQPNTKESDGRITQLSRDAAWDEGAHDDG